MSLQTHALDWLLFAALSTSGTAFASSVPNDLPKGWRSPSAKQTSQEFRRKDGNHFVLAVGDFNGDGIEDKAVLLVNDGGSKLGFFVCLRTTSACDWRLVEEMDVALVDAMGIATVKAGKYKTACGKGYDECEKDEPATLVLKHEAIEFFKAESASSYYFYDPQKNKFIAVAISD